MYLSKSLNKYSSPCRVTSRFVLHDTYSDINLEFRHFQAYSPLTQTYSATLRHIQNPVQLFDVQNPIIFSILAYLEPMIRSSRPVAGAYNFIKKETPAQVFSCEFCEISKNTFFTEHLWWLLLHDDMFRTLANHILAYSERCVTLAY